MKKTFIFLSLSSVLLWATDNAVIFGLSEGGKLSLRNAPITGAKIDKLTNGTKLTILKRQGKWYKINVTNSHKVGWAHGDWIKILPSVKKTLVHTKNSVPKNITRTTQTPSNIATKKVNYQDVPQP